jgi:pseudouridine synthase
MTQRLQKILAQATDLSRRAAEKAIEEGLVKVNGRVVTKMGVKADPARDEIIYKGRVLRFNFPKIYIAYFKPRNTIVSKSDPEGRPTIWDRLHKDMAACLNAAGRLDFESEGLLILTSDGEALNRLTHPSHELWKTYLVKVSGIPNEKELAAVRDGVRLDDGVTLPARVKLFRSTDKNATLELSIQEGKNRQIRRMMNKLGHMVMKLRRTAIGEMRLGNLRPGEWRYLNKREVGYLKNI